MCAKKILVTEEQVNLISKKYPVDPKKVLLVKKYLDKSFQKGTIPYIGNDGMPDDMPVVFMMNSNGEVVRIMRKDQLFYLLQSRFNDEKHLFADKEQCDSFLKFMVEKWMNNDIDEYGLIKHSNMY